MDTNLAWARILFNIVMLDIISNSKLFKLYKLYAYFMVGNIPNYTKIDVLRCFLEIEKHISRKELVRVLGLGEGTVRTILGILKKKKIISSTRKGHSLTNKGNKLLKKINNIVEIKRVDSNIIYPKSKKVGILVKGRKKRKIDYRLRDIAVKNKADGAVMFVFDKRLYLPNVDYSSRFAELEKEFNFKKGNLLIISFSNNYKNAESGALAIAMSICKDLNIKNILK